MANGSNQGTGGNVTRLDTQSFADVIAAYNTYLNNFQSIVSNVNNTINAVVDQSKWRGHGRNAFRDNSSQVQLNLRDISDFMTEMRDVLVGAYNDYSEVDREIGNAFNS